MEDFYVAHLSPLDPSASVSGGVSPQDSGGASVSAQGTLQPSDQEALDAYILPSGPGEPISYLQAALGDAEATRSGERPALWLATLGYLVIIEQVSNTVQSTNTPIRRDKDDRRSFVVTLQEFGDSELEDDQREVLYDVRCALAHNFGLTASGRTFAYDVEGPMLTPLGGDPIVVNLTKVWALVEALVSKLRAEHLAGHVRILYNVKPSAVLAMRFQIGARPTPSRK